MLRASGSSGSRVVTNFCGEVRNAEMATFDRARGQSMQRGSIAYVQEKGLMAGSHRLWVWCNSNSIKYALSAYFMCGYTKYGV